MPRPDRRVLSRPRLAVLIVAATAALFLSLGDFAATELIATQQADQLRDLGGAAARRVEAALDHGALTLDELAAQGVADCAPDALRAVRQHVYGRGGVKDIRLLGPEGQVRCAAFPEMLGLDVERADRRLMLAAAGDARLFVSRIEQKSGVALSVLRDMEGGRALLAVVAIDAALLDVLPEELREGGSVTLDLGDGRRVLRSPDSGREAPARNALQITAASRRYPLQVTLVVDRGALSGWRHGLYAPLFAGMGLLGLIFGVLSARMATRPADPAAALDAALERKEFTAYLQPVFDLKTGAIVGCEALVRWVRSDGAVIPPSRFVPLAETSGRIEPITWQMMEETLRRLRPLLGRHRRFKLSFNIAPHHLLSEGFADALEARVREAGIRPGQIVLEITERERVGDLYDAAQVVAALRERGFRVALDDVGIGHSGLCYIQTLGASILKVDKFFVDAVCHDPAAAAIVQMLVRLADRLKLRVVAEGIESRAQLDALAACGVDEGQGYLVSPPVPIDAFLASIHAREPARKAGPALAMAA